MRSTLLASSRSRSTEPEPRRIIVGYECEWFLDRVELIERGIVTTSPIGPRHAACVKKLGALLRNLLPGEAIVAVQDPVRLNDYSEPLPDFSVLLARDDFYASAHPGPESVVLLIEVADPSMMYDRNTKLPLYARLGIPEVWLVDLVKNIVELHSSPGGGGYDRMQRFERGATVTSAQLAELRIQADEILVG